METNKRLLSSIIAISIVANLTACSNTKAKYYELQENQTSVVASSDNLNLQSSSVTGLEFVLSSKLFDQNIDYLNVIRKYLSIDYYDRYQMRDEYLKAIYMMMYNSDVPMNIYLHEIHDLSVLQQVPMCLPDDYFHATFQNLIDLYPCSSIFDLYSDFAMYVHGVRCGLPHNTNEFGCYTCQDLKTEYNRKLKKASSI